MALTAEERKYLIQYIGQNFGIMPRSSSEAEKFFTLIEADDEGKRVIIKEYITKEIASREDNVTRYNQMIASEQALIADLQAKVK